MRMTLPRRGRTVRTLLPALAALVAILAFAAGARAAVPAQAPPVVAPAPPVVAPAPPLVGTPVLGASLLGPDQLAGWYASTGIVSRSPTDVGLLARIFIDEGAAQGVRGDLAFAQTMLETGYLRYGGQVRPDDHNFSGLGACDSCRRGLAFPNPQLGVRAQIQHLWAYASPLASPLTVARPLADVRFGLVQPVGRAPLWEMMGAGNWATGPDYATKVLTIWRSMLAWAGIPEPPPLPAPAGVPQGPLLVRSSAAGAGSLGGWPLRREPLSGGLARLGPPARTTRGGAVCLVRWPALGAAVLVGGEADPCATGSRVRWARLSNPIWRTQRGLSPGDPAARMRGLYPAARRVGRHWWLVTGRAAGTRRPAPRLRAEIRDARVGALWIAVG